jgi:lysophospholipase L1-like esterase
MRARDRGRALGQILALGAALAVVCAAAPGTAVAEPVAQQQPQQQPQQQQRVFKMVVVGDSFSAGQGVRGPSNGRMVPRIYLDATDPRHQSTESAAIQAAARLQAANPGLKVEVTIVASSGAATSDVFETQRRDALERSPGNPDQNPIDPSTWHDANDLAVNTRQLDQIPTDADAVVVGLGGNDVFFGPMVRSLAPWPSHDTDTVLGRANPLLDTEQSDQAYLDQAEQGRLTNKQGYEPTLVARLIQVMRAVQQRVPNAKLFLQNYPRAVDPNKTSFNSPLDKDELTSMGKFGDQVNAAIKRAIEICGCADLIDVSNALKDRELYANVSAMNDLSKGFSSSNNPYWEADEAAHPNDKGASLMAGDIGDTVAKRFGLKAPPRQGDRRTDVRGITIKNAPAPDTDGDGEADYKDKDWDGDGTPNTEDQTPNTPNQPQQTPRPPTGPTGSQTDRPTTQPGTTTPDTRPGPNPTPAPPQPNPAPAPAPAQQPSPAPAPPQQPAPAPQQPSPAPTPQPPAPAPTPPEQPNPAPTPPSPAPQSTPRTGNSPVIPPSSPMRSPAVPSMPKAPSANSQPTIGPPPPISRLGTPPPPPVVTVPSSRAPNPYPLGSGKPSKGSSGSSGSSTPPPPVPQRAPTPPTPPSSFVGA